MNILVTGGAGYLGSVLCEILLDKGYKVTTVDSLMYRQKSLFHLCNNPNFDFVFGDVRDKNLMHELIKNADVIVPLAAIVGTSACDSDPYLATTTNLDSIKLLNKLRSKNQLVVFPMTNNGYGTPDGRNFCTEETPLNPTTLYGKTKTDAEEELLSSKNTITLRLASVFGMSPRLRLDLLVNHFVYTALTDGYIVLFEKNFKRNFVHIRDVVDCFIYSIENHKKMIGKAYNLGLDSENLSKKELAGKIKQHLPKFYIDFAEINSDPDKRNYIVSSQRLKIAGFEAKRSLDEGIKELIKGYQLIKRSEFKNI